MSLKKKKERRSGIGCTHKVGRDNLKWDSQGKPHQEGEK